MRGNFYIQREIDGSLVEKPLKITGSITVENKILHGFSGDSYLLKMNVMDFTVSSDGIMFMGIEEVRSGTKTYQEIWFLPKR